MKIVKSDFCGNLGGIEKMYVIAPDLLESITHNHTEWMTFLTLVNEEDIIELCCTEDTKDFTEEQSRQSAGPLYQVEISGIIPKERKLNQRQLLLLDGGYWLLLFIDMNGLIRLAGDLENHLIFTRTATTGQSIASRNQVSFSFTGQQSHPCYFIEDINLNFI